MARPLDVPLAYFDEAAIAAAPLRREPYEYAFVDQAIPLRFRDLMLSDAPQIPGRGHYDVMSLNYGPCFGVVIEELLSPRFRRLVETKFDMDLSRNPPVILMTGNTRGHVNEGFAHTDSRHKVVTVSLGFSREWPWEKGRLRVLNSADREDVAFEFPPEFGKMLMYKVSDRSWHGYLPRKGPRMSLQLCFADSEAYVYGEYLRHGVSAIAKSIPGVNRILEWAPG